MFVVGCESPEAAWIVALDVETGGLVVWSTPIHITGVVQNLPCHQRLSKSNQQGLSKSPILRFGEIDS